MLVPAWRLLTNLYKFGKIVSSHISHKINCYVLKLGESLTIFTFVSQNLDIFYSMVLIFSLVYFEWRDTENHSPRASFPGLKFLETRLIVGEMNCWPRKGVASCHSNHLKKTLQNIFSLHECNLTKSSPYLNKLFRPL